MIKVKMGFILFFKLKLRFYDIVCCFLSVFTQPECLLSFKLQSGTDSNAGKLNSLCSFASNPFIQVVY